MLCNTAFRRGHFAKVIWVVSVTLGMCSSLSAGDNWPSFRGAGANGVAEGHAVAVKWDVGKSENVLWKTAIPGMGHSSPVVWEDRIYVTTAVKGEGQSRLKVGLYGDVVSEDEKEAFSWRIYCLDRKTGNVLWNKEAHHGVPAVKRHPKSSHANHTPCTDGKRVVVFFGSEGLYCYDMEGKELWKKDLGLLDWGYYRMGEAQWGGSSSPVIHGDMLILQCDVQRDSFIAAYDLKDGTEIWKTPRDEVPTWGTPTVYAGKEHSQIIVNGYKHIGGYEIATGREIWRMKGGGDIPVPTPVVANGLIYITNAHGRAPIYAIRISAKGDISLGEGQSSNKHVAWSYGRGGNYMQTPVFYKGYLYLCSDRGNLSCYQPKTGERIYSERLGSGIGGFSASTVAADGKIYCTSELGKVFVVKAGPEFEIISINDMGETCMATPAIYRGMLLFRTRSNVVAIAKNGGE
ncbi:MAG: outer membrane protein assembly factor BamB family protein [Planctomycetota bacterium]|jgi:outer membrane protein assembly factor BamB